MLLSLFTLAQTPGENDLRVMTFNVRNSGMRDADNGWKFRKELFFKVIDTFNPDLLGTQEVLADQYDQIAEHFKDYAVVGVARDDGKRKGEWAAVLYRKDRFDLLDSGNFWLSEKPEEVGSKSWDAALTRICSWATLKDKKTGREFIFANTHFDHRGEQARINSAKLLKSRLAVIGKNRPIILCGDFNCDEDDKPYAALVGGKEEPILADSYREVHPKREKDEASFHDFKGGTEGSRIDWIVHTTDLQATAAEIVRTRSQDGHYPSDHFPVTAILGWKK